MPAYTIEMNDEPVVSHVSPEMLAAYATNMADIPYPNPTVPAGTLDGLGWDSVNKVVSSAIWKWFAEHREDTVIVIKVRLIFFPLRITVKVWHCEWLLKALFGSEGIITPILNTNPTQ